MAANAPAGGLRLEVAEGPEAGPFDIRPGGGPVAVGRDPGCAVPLAVPSVSWRHAELRAEGACWSAADAGSRHGTCLNTVRLEPGETAALASGDLLRVGAVVLSVTIGDAGRAAEGYAGDEPALPGPAYARGDTLATRPSIFLRLREDETIAREVSWHEFVERYRGVIVGFARRAGLAAADADDVVQEVLVGFFRVSDRFEYDPSRGRFRGYLKRVTLNAIRARARRARIERGGDVELAEHDGARLDRLWDQEWTRQTLDRAIDEARGRFGATVWEAFQLYGQRGVPAEAVADQLGMSESAVRHAKSRAARMIRECLERLRDEEG